MRRHIAYIDGLRAVAVLAVIAFHLNPAWLPGGFAGVDVFFVISGFVVSASLAGLGRPSFGAYLGHFYSRRLRRIAPALLVCLLVTGLATALFVPSAWLSDANERTGLMAFFGLSNFELLDASGDYFSRATELNPYTHTWSLGVEEQFYLVFPLLMFAWARWRRAGTALLAAAAVASLAYAVTASGDAAFYMLTGRFWELAAGALLFQLTVGRAPIARGARPGLLASCAVLVAGLALARPSRTPFPDGLLAVAGTLGILAFMPGVAAGDLVRRALESRGAVAVGKISYSLYLWHWPVFVLFRWTVGHDSVLTGGAALALTLALAVASYRFVERPFRYAPAIRLAPRYAVVAVAVLAVVAGSSAYRQVVDHRGALSLSVTAASPADWYTTHDTTCMPGRAAFHGGSVTRFSPAACGGPQASGRLFAMGDSHALMYEPMLREAAMRSGRELVLFSMGGCVVGLAPAEPEPGCRRFAKAAQAEVAGTARDGDVLFLPSLRLPRLSQQWGTARPARVAARFDETRDAAALAPLTRRGVRVVLAGPTPVFRAPAFRCADWFNRRNPICRGGLRRERAAVAASRAPVLAAFDRLARRVDGVEMWDPLPALCPERSCSAMSGRRPLFFDGDHVSMYANRLLAPGFAEALGSY